LVQIIGMVQGRILGGHPDEVFGWHDSVDYSQISKWRLGWSTLSDRSMGLVRRAILAVLTSLVGV
jgi:hypothetical protein